jgi:hypothetical protein
MMQRMLPSLRYQAVTSGLQIRNFYEAVREGLPYVKFVGDYN